MPHQPDSWSENNSILPTPHPFHEVALLLQQWQKEITPGHERIALFPLPEDTSWEDTPHSIKNARLASILGLHLADRYGGLTQEMLGKVIGTYENSIDQLGLREFSRQVIDDWNQEFASDVNSRKLPVDTIDRIIYLPKSRIYEITQGDESTDLAFILEEGDILLPIDEETAMPGSNEDYEAQAHELTHAVRSKLDDIGPPTWIGEAIAQKAANRLSTQNNKITDRTDRVYAIEVQTITMIQRDLGITDQQLLNMRLSDFANRVDETYAIPGQLVDIASDTLSQEIQLLNTHYYDASYDNETFQQEWQAFQRRWRRRA